jgi:hypothetical protein
MFKTTLGLVLATAFAAACSQSSPPPATGAGAAQPPTATAQPAAQPPAQPAASPAAPQAQTPEPGSPADAPAASPQSELAATSVPAGTAGKPEPQSELAETQEPEFKEVTIPAGTTLTVTLSNAIASDANKLEDPVEGTLAKSIVISGKTVVPAHSKVLGTITEANESGRVKGKASIRFQFNRLVAHGETHKIRTSLVTREAESSTKDDVKKGGIGAGVGAVVGGIAGGGTGAAVGAAVGGTGTVLATKGKEVRLPAGTTVTTTLQDPVTVQVRIKPKQ